MYGTMRLAGDLSNLVQKFFLFRAIVREQLLYRLPVRLLCNFSMLVCGSFPPVGKTFLIAVLYRALYLRSKTNFLQVGANCHIADSPIIHQVNGHQKRSRPRWGQIKLMTVVYITAVSVLVACGTCCRSCSFGGSG